MARSVELDMAFGESERDAERVIDEFCAARAIDPALPRR